MKAGQPKPDDMRMSEAEFERIMGHALQVSPEAAAKPKRIAKPKAPTADKHTKK